MGSWKGRGNQYIEFARVVYCKLPTNGKQLPAFPLKAVTGIEPPTSEVGVESVTTLPPWPLMFIKGNSGKLVLRVTQLWYSKGPLVTVESEYNYKYHYPG